jgi:hypothetical protein
MAIRIHVTAARDCDPEEMRAIFTRRLGADFENVPLHEHNGWVWFTTSVWCVDPVKLNGDLCELARPALQFTTSDGARWYLTVHGGPHGQEHFLHEFYYHQRAADPAEDAERQAELDFNQAEEMPVDPRLAFLEDDPPPGGSRPRSPFDMVADALWEIGGRRPDSFLDEVVGLPYSAALNRYREWHAERIAEALRAAGIPFDREALRRVLLWEDVTELERGSDLGNLPRLLSVLGLGGDWDQWVEQAENPPDTLTYAEYDGHEEEPDRTTAPDHLDQVLRCVEPLALVPVQGGPVSLPVKRLDRVAFFAEACSTEESPMAALRVELPPGPERELLARCTEDDFDAQVVLRPDGFEAGIIDSEYLARRDLTDFIGKKLTKTVFKLPDGAVLECDLAADGEPATYQRYRGPVRDATWWIEATHPPLTHDALTGALELALRSEKKQHEARDEAEAEAVMRAVARDSFLHDMGVERKGLTIRCEYDGGDLAKLLFRVRYREHWDMAAAEQRAEQEYRERLENKRQMRRNMVDAARKRAVPRIGPELLRGEQSRYWVSDIRLLTELDPEFREKFDAAMLAHDFRHVGDLVAKKQRDIVMRVFISSDWLAYGVLMAKRTMYLGYEFVSRFLDDSMLTTSINAALESHPEVGIYYKTCASLEPAPLYQKHLWAVERFRTHRDTEPVPLEPTLLGVAQELDAAFARRAAVEE